MWPIPSIPCFLLFFFLLLLLQTSQAMVTVVVDGLADWKSPIVHVGDSVVFKHEQVQNLYLFRNRRAFDLCSFDQSILIYDGKSSLFTWRPSRHGYYYLATRNSSQRSCEQGEKVPVRVVTPRPSPGFPSLPAPAPTSGGDISSSPSNSWTSVSSPRSVPGPSPSPSPSPSAAPVDFGPLQPKERLTPAATPSSSVTAGSVPFISSSPAVPLPVGETDTATILPFPTPGSETQVRAPSSPALCSFDTHRMSCAALCFCVFRKDD
ncbi:hypothetical protein BHM03_00027071 [Ensete ventricosum]|nr:hypothetical protein BHM03_00027071 [Ensete ventricosum]